MKEVTFYNPDTKTPAPITWAVVACRFEGQWIFCKENASLRFLSAACAEGESAAATAKRILRDHLGADCTPDATRAFSLERSGTVHCGMLFFAEPKQIKASPSLALCDLLPKELDGQTAAKELFFGIQTWLNLRCGANELWDIYDKDRKPTGRLHRRGDFIKPGDYHIVVQAWLLNSKGEFLLTKRAPNKGHPNMWESTSGSAVAGDDSLHATLREIREETGLIADPAKGSMIHSFRADTCFVDVWLFRQDFDLNDVILQEGETCDKMYASKETIRDLLANGQFVPCSYLERIFAITE